MNMGCSNCKKVKYCSHECREVKEERNRRLKKTAHGIIEKALSPENTYQMPCSIEEVRQSFIEDVRAMLKLLGNADQKK